MLGGAPVSVERRGELLIAPDGRQVVLHAAVHLPPVEPANSRPVEPGDAVTVELEGLGALTKRLGGDRRLRGGHGPQGPGAAHTRSARDDEAEGAG
jgi:5-oxopent-3-ene-1,2,5-tricarboxylate decarboxylase / 2-hydroxyhepta-2,4-diene-1,7-dioate isomerase